MMLLINISYDTNIHIFICEQWASLGTGGTHFVEYKSQWLLAERN